MIGRITVGERKSFVGIPLSVGRELLARTQVLVVRGVEARIAPARARAYPPRDPRR